LAVGYLSFYLFGVCVIPSPKRIHILFFDRLDGHPVSGVG
jgi:hypothetical protein